ncbi:MAG: hypothetical protein JXA41_02510 [Deltaproteobacteria bacterium]|nr:hypothetical protein [Deltaproteobacteria bacterium]
MPVNSEIEKIIQTYRDYIDAFQSLNPQAILPFYHVPFVSISAREVQVLNSPVEIENSFARNMEILRENKYVRTDVVELHARQMSKGLALISVNLERYDADGRQLGGPGRIYPYTYTLRKTEDSWKIVAVMAHDPEAILRMG